MADITGKRGSKVTMFPVTLDGFIPPSTHVASARIREPAGDGGVGFPAQRVSEDGTAGLGPARLAEAIPVPYMNQVCSWRQLETECQPRSDVTAAARRQVDCRFSADAFPSRVFCRSGEREVEGPLFLRKELRRVVHLSLTDLLRRSKHEIQINYFRNVSFDDSPCLF